MVTFVCYYCDATLKKKQLETHQYQCRQPTSFICIDCRQTFNGGDHKSHTQCMTEKEKYWGQYKDGVPGKKKQGQNQQQQQQQQQKQKQEQERKQKEEEEAKKQEEELKKKQEEEEEKEEDIPEFLGWKKEIRKILKEQEKAKLKRVKKRVVEAFLKANPEWKEKDAEATFDEKINNKKYQLLEGGKFIAFAKK